MGALLQGVPGLPPAKAHANKLLNVGCRRRRCRCTPAIAGRAAASAARLPSSRCCPCPRKVGLVDVHGSSQCSAAPAPETAAATAAGLGPPAGPTRAGGEAGGRAGSRRAAPCGTLLKSITVGPRWAAGAGTRPQPRGSSSSPALAAACRGVAASQAHQSPSSLSVSLLAAGRGRLLPPALRLLPVACAAAAGTPAGLASKAGPGGAAPSCGTAAPGCNGAAAFAAPARFSMLRPNSAAAAPPLDAAPGAGAADSAA